MRKASPIEIQLLALIVAGELSGREVAKRFKEKTGRSISYGTLYITLRRMFEYGWVKTREERDDDGRILFVKIDVGGIAALHAGLKPT